MLPITSQTLNCLIHVPCNSIIITSMSYSFHVLCASSVAWFFSEALRLLHSSVMDVSWKNCLSVLLEFLIDFQEELVSYIGEFREYKFFNVIKVFL